MDAVERDVRMLGGVAATRELLARSHSRGLIWRAVEAGALIRVRKGWYAISTLDAPVIAALRVGGRLACVSAAQHHGLWIPDEPQLHVAVPDTASRLRRPADHRARLADHPGDGVIVHWADDKVGSRLVVGAADSIVQMFSCLPHRDAFVVLESALRHGLLPISALPELRARLPLDAQRTARHASMLSDSGTESLVKLALLRLGIPFRQQAQIRGVGRVDFLIGDRLVIEVDSLAFHPDPHRDRSRDGELGLRGFRVLRFMYWHVRRDIGWVERVITAAYLRGDHLAG